MANILKSTIWKLINRTGQLISYKIKSFKLSPIFLVYYVECIYRKSKKFFAAVATLYGQSNGAQDAHHLF